MGLPPRARAFLRRRFRLGEEAAERIFERAEESHHAALAVGSFQSARAVRQSTLVACPIRPGERRRRNGTRRSPTARDESRPSGHFGIDMTALLFYTGGHGDGYDT